MLYAAVRPLAKLGLKMYFRRIELANLDRIPKTGPVILAANHPTTFIEPCILACFLDRPLNFLARGDFFKNPIAARLLKGVHIIPVFRLRDAGFSGIKNNYESFNRSFSVLEQGNQLMILAEGRCIHEKRLRPIRKGTARIALGALDSKELDEIPVIPIGVNFTYADRLRSDVMLSCGEPIKASKYLADYRNNANQTIQRFTSDLRQQLAKEIVIVDHIEDEPLVENLLRLYRTEHYRNKTDIVTFTDEQLRGEITIADAVNAMPADAKSELKALSHDYFSRLERMRIDDAAFAGKYRNASKRNTAVLFGFIPALLTLVWHLPPLLFSQWLAGSKIKTVEFSSPVRWAALMVSYLLFALVGIVLSLVTSQWWILLLTVIGLLSAKPLIHYVALARQWLLHWRAKRQTEHEVKYLRQIRKKLIEKLQVITAE